MPRDDDSVEVNATWLRRSQYGNSFQIEDANGREHWLPDQECDLDPEDPDRHDNVTVTLPEWLARKEGLI